MLRNSEITVGSPRGQTSLINFFPEAGYFLLPGVTVGDLFNHKPHSLENAQELTVKIKF